jgi:hypothetical protein
MVKVVNQLDSVRAVVFGVLTDFERYPTWVPGCEKVVVTSSADNVTNLDITLNNMKRLTLSLKFECEPDVLIKFEMTAASDVKAYSGSYRLLNSEGNNGTVLVTELELDAGPMAPKFMVDRMLKKSLEDSGNALKKYAKTRPVPVSDAPAEAEEPAGPKKPKRARCLLRVFKTDSGEEQVWYGGRVFAPK